MTQHNLTQILKVIRDLVMRNRPCYRDYLGSETTQTSTQIGSGVFKDYGGMAGTEFPATDSSFTGFVLGETYTVAIGGVTEDFVARNLSPISEQYGPIIGTTTSVSSSGVDGWFVTATQGNSEVLFIAQTLDTSFIGKTISIFQTKTETVERYDTKLLPEYLLPEFLRKNVVASKAEVKSAADAAATAQTTANAKFQLLKQTTVTTTTTIGTVDNNVGPVSVKGLNIAVGSTIKFTSDGGRSGTAVWDGPGIAVYMQTALPGPSISLSLTLLQDGETYIFTNQTPATTLSNLVIEYEKVEIPKTVHMSRLSGAWLPPYLIANCLYLTKKNAGSYSATLYRITVDDTGTLTATEVT